MTEQEGGGVCKSADRAEPRPDPINFTGFHKSDIDQEAKLTKVTHIRLHWAGGTHRFQLLFDHSAPSPFNLTAPLPALHDRVRLVLKRLVEATWGVDDIATTIRCALIGGGDFKVAPDRLGFKDWREVDDLIGTHVLKRPLSESVALAQTILLAAIVGVDPGLANRGLDPVSLTLEDAAEAVAAEA